MIDLNFPNAITDEKDFYGRKDELQRSERVFLSSHRKPVIILGERRIGKTSLLNMTLKRLQSIEEQLFVPLSVEPRGITSFNEFTRAILQRLSTRLQNSMYQKGSLDLNSSLQIETIEQFEPVFISLVGSQPKEMFLICVDEFDEIVRKAPDHELSKMLGLILTIIERTSLPVTFFLTMTYLPEELQKEKPSPLISKSETIELDSLTADEMAEMVQDILQEQVILPKAGVDWLYQISGGHPYFAKLLLANLVERRHSDRTVLQVTQTMLEHALEHALDDPRGDHALKNLYEVHFTDPEKELVLLLAERERRIDEYDLKIAGSLWITTARRLERRRYLNKDHGSFGLRIPLLGYWLRNSVEFDEERERLSTLRQRLAEPVEVEIDALSRQVRVRGQSVSLTPQEFRILECLVQRVGQVVDRNQIIESVWKTGQGVSDEVIDTAISRLRKKLGDEKYIRTARGQGLSLHHAVLIAQE